MAFLRLDMDAVCRVAADGRGDYHDYVDDKFGMPSHMVPLTCVRCGREFYI